MTLGLSIIVAMTPSRVIGHEGRIPWRIPDDLKLFKSITEGKTVVMGRRTYESLHNRPLPDRNNVVISTTLEPKAGITIARTLEEALERAKEFRREVFIIGGSSIYEQSLPLVDTLHVSHIRQEYEGDTYFPEIKRNEWITKEEKDFRDFTYKRYIRGTQD